MLANYEGLKQNEAQIPPEEKDALPRDAAARLVQLYDAWGKPDEAAKWRKELAARPADSRKKIDQRLSRFGPNAQLIVRGSIPHLRPLGGRPAFSGFGATISGQQSSRNCRYCTRRTPTTSVTFASNLRSNLSMRPARIFAVLLVRNRWPVRQRHHSAVVPTTVQFIQLSAADAAAAPNLSIGPSTRNFGGKLFGFHRQYTDEQVDVDELFKGHTETVTGGSFGRWVMSNCQSDIRQYFQPADDEGSRS